MSGADDDDHEHHGDDSGPDGGVCERLELTCTRLKGVEFDEASRPLHVYGVASGDGVQVRVRSAKERKARAKELEKKRLRVSASSRANLKAAGGDLAAFSLVERVGAVASQYALDSDDAKDLFGVPLWRCIERERALGRGAACSVPFLVEALCDLLRAKHLSEPGIFRVSGQTDAVQALRNKLAAMTARAKFDISLLVADDPHVCANVLKQFIRELPEPLIPFEMFDAVVAVADVDDDSERALRLRGAMAQLPLERYAVLRYLIEFLTDVHAFAAVNQMTSSNLAIIFGPALLHPPSHQLASPAYLLAMPKVNLVVDSLIAHADYVFDIGLPQLLLATPDHIRAAQAAVDAEKDVRKRAASAAAATSKSQPILSSAAVAAATAANNAAAAAATAAAAAAAANPNGAAARDKPVRFCELCQQKRAKHVVNFKNGTRWMLCPDCLQRARAQRENQKQQSGVHQPTVAPAATGGATGGANALRTQSAEPTAAASKAAKTPRDSDKAVTMPAPATAPATALCEACGKEPPKFRITLRNGTKQKVCQTCMQAKQDLQQKKVRTGSAPEPPKSPSPPAQQQQQQRQQQAQQPSSLNQSMIGAARLDDEAPPPPAPDEQEVEAEFDPDVPPPPPPSDEPPPPPEPELFDEPPPPPPPDEESAAPAQAEDDEAQKTWRMQSQKRQHRLDVARSRVALEPINPATDFGAPPAHTPPKRALVGSSGLSMSSSNNKK